VRTLGRRPLDVVHAHFSHDHLIARFGTPPGARLVRSVHAPRSLRWSLPRADAYTVPTAADAKKLEGRTVMVLPALVGPEFQPPGDRAALRRDLGLDGGPLYGMVSTFQASRQHSVGVEAFRRLHGENQEARLVLVGDGALEGELRAQVEALGLSKRVTFAGYQKGAAFVRWLQALDQVWVLGLGNDYSGRAAAQARACGVRVVGVDEGALGEQSDVTLAELTPATLAVAASAAKGLSSFSACPVQPERSRGALDPARAERTRTGSANSVSGPDGGSGSAGDKPPPYGTVATVLHRNASVEEIAQAVLALYRGETPPGRPA
jgi:hypothetical protein